MHQTVYLEVPDFIVQLEHHFDIQFVETDSELDLRFEMTQTQIQMMDAATCVLSKQAIHALVDLHQSEICEILFVETDLELDLNNETTQI